MERVEWAAVVITDLNLQIQRELEMLSLDQYV
jgi:hypothetical protein